MRFLVPQKYFVVPDTGWSDWDLKIARGLWSRALVLVCTENHGGAKRLLRVRCAMRLSRFAVFLLRSYAALTAFALILGWPLTAACGRRRRAGQHRRRSAAQLVEFGRLMHRIIEAVASRPGSCRSSRSSRSREQPPLRGPRRRLHGLILLTKLLPYLRPYRWRFAWALAQVFLIAGFELLKPWPLQIVIDDVLGGKPLPIAALAALSPGALLLARLPRHRRRASRRRGADPAAQLHDDRRRASAWSTICAALSTRICSGCRSPSTAGSRSAT